MAMDVVFRRGLRVSNIEGFRVLGFEEEEEEEEDGEEEEVALIDIDLGGHDHEVGGNRTEIEEMGLENRGW